MDEALAVPPARSAAPLWFWIVSLLSLAWNAFGCVDYTMTQTRNAAYLANFPPEMMAVLDEFPAWITAAWALGVWGALAGSILLLLRSRLAVHAFAVSLAGLAASTAYQWTIDMPESLKSGGQTAMQVVIWAAAIGLLWFAVNQRRKGVLR